MGNAGHLRLNIGPRLANAAWQLDVELDLGLSSTVADGHNAAVLEREGNHALARKHCLVVCSDDDDDDDAQTKPNVWFTSRISSSSTLRGGITQAGSRRTAPGGNTPDTQ